MLLQKAIIALFAFSLFAVMLNASGIFDITLPDQGLSPPNVSRVVALTETDTVQDSNLVGDILGSAASFVFSIFESFFSIVFSIIGVEGLLKSYGVPAPMRTMLYGMLSLIAVMSLIFIIANRGDKGVS